MFKEKSAYLIFVGAGIRFHIAACQITSVFFVEYKYDVGISSRVHFIVRPEPYAVKCGTPCGGRAAS